MTVTARQLWVLRSLTNDGPATAPELVQRATAERIRRSIGAARPAAVPAWPHRLLWPLLQRGFTECRWDAAIVWSVTPAGKREAERSERMADADARQAAIRDASERVRTGGPFTRRAPAQADNRRALVDAIAKRRCNPATSDWVWRYAPESVRDQFRAEAEAVLRTATREPVIRDALVDSIVDVFEPHVNVYSLVDARDLAESAVASVFGHREGASDAG